MDNISSMKTLPAPVDLSHHFSRVTKNRAASNVKDFYKYFSIPGIGNLAGGLPNNNYFPYDTLEARVALPQRFKPTPVKPVDPPLDQQQTRTLSSTQESAHVVVPKTTNTSNLLQKIDLKSALQYGTAQGYPPLYGWIRQFVRENLHPNVPYANGPEIILTCGSTDGFAKIIEALTNTWSQDHDKLQDKEGLLVEEFAYMNAVQATRPRGLNIVPVKVDDEGMTASGLEDVLEGWDESKGKRPHLIYTVTIGQNPTGTTMGVQRRKDIYALCCRYDIIIIEDDPYWYLQYPSANPLSVSTCDHPKFTDALPGLQNYNTSAFNGMGKSSGYPFLDSLVPSYLSVDTQGRVVRIDTFSKTVAPGCRLGWLTAQPALVERILRITETSTQQPSGFVQSLIAELVVGPEAGSKHGGRGGTKDGAGWKVEGWVRWLEGLRGNYERRMQTMCSILDSGKCYVNTGRVQSISDSGDISSSEEEVEGWAIVEKRPMYTFIWPLGGMFVWLRLNLQSHPLFDSVSHAKLAHALWVHLTTEPYLVLVAPGILFSPTDEIRDKKGWGYFRLCFAAVDEADVEKTSRRFVDGCRSFWEKKRLGEDEEGVGEEGV